MKTYIQKDFIALLEVYFQYFENNKEKFTSLISSTLLEDIILEKNNALRKIFVPVLDKRIEVWINKSIYYDTEYVVFGEKTTFLKNNVDELKNDVLSVFEKLNSLEYYKITKNSLNF